MALALITAARKLRPYFQAYQIKVYMNCPLKLILQKLEVSGRLTKWAIELSEFNIKYLPRTVIKVPMAYLPQPSITGQTEVGVIEHKLDEWTTPSKEYLTDDILSDDPLEAKRLKYKSMRYSVLSGELSRRGFSRVLQRCVRSGEAEGILNDIHSGSCGNHTGGVSLTHKALRQGFYWPTLFVDAKRISARRNEERRELAQIRNAAYQQRAARYYNSHLRLRRFSLGDLVLRRVSLGTKDRAAWSLVDKWEGSYHVTGIAEHEAYRIARVGAGELPPPCNAQYLKIYYP
ncbi:hypothetical protein QYF36_004922 [Acer negundo]|nr:hypothetical protein QYF36_004922 [Acer negundo]